MADQELTRLAVSLEATSTKLAGQLAKFNGTTLAAMKKAEAAAAATAAVVESKFVAATAKAGAGVTGFAAMASRGLGTLGVAVGAGEAVSFLASTMKELADLDDFSQQIGVDAETIQALQFAAQQAGVENEQFRSGLLKMSRELGDVGSKSSELGRIFRANGVAYQSANGQLLPLTQNLISFARLVANAKNDQEAAALATAAFGREGARLVPTLRDMAGGLGGVSEAAAKAGVVVSNELVARAGAFDDAWTAAILHVKAGLASLLLSIPNPQDLAKVYGAFGVTRGGLSLDDLRSKYTNPDPNAGIGMPVGENPMARMDSAEAAAVAADARGAAMTTLSLAFQSAASEVAREASRGAALTGLPAPPASKTSTSKNTVMPPPVGGGGGGGGGSSKSAYQSEVDSIQKKIEALKAEAATVGMAAGEEAKYKAVQELTNAAQKAGIPITADLKAKIDAQASALAAATTAAEAAKKAHQDMVSAMDDLRSTTSSALGTFITDLKDGKSAVEALGDAVNIFLDSSIKNLSDQFAAGLFGASGSTGGGFFGSLFSGFGKAPGVAAAPVAASAPVAAPMIHIEQHFGGVAGEEAMGRIAKTHAQAGAMAALKAANKALPSRSRQAHQLGS